jgi:flagellar basal-body rod modification protein FlgD
MTTSISGVTDYVDSTSSTTTNKGTLDKNTFTTLLLAQLKNQDPLNPMDSSQFSTQLAQFSSLEQLYNINDNLTAMNESQSGVTKSQALDLIGKEIEATGNKLSLGEEGTATGGLTIGSAANCAAVISNANGTVIKTIDLGSLEAGDHTFEWDGTNQAGTAMAQGSYTFKIVAETASGQSVSATTNITGIVSKVDLSTSDPTLYIGSLPVLLSQVSNVTLAED